MFLCARVAYTCHGVVTVIGYQKQYQGYSYHYGNGLWDVMEGISTRTVFESRTTPLSVFNHCHSSADGIKLWPQSEICSVMGYQYTFLTSVISGHITLYPSTFSGIYPISTGLFPYAYRFLTSVY